MRPPNRLPEDWAGLRTALCAARPAAFPPAEARWSSSRLRTAFAWMPQFLGPLSPWMPSPGEGGPAFLLLIPSEVGNPRGSRTGEKLIQIPIVTAAAEYHA